MTWSMEVDSRQASAAVTPEEEQVLKYPVMEEQPPSRNFTPVQLIILFIQFCLVGVFLGAILSNDSDDKDAAPPQKFVVLTVEREKKAGGGFRYRLVGTKKGGVEAIILENLPSGDQSSIFEDDETKEQTTVHNWIPTFKPSMKINAPKEKVSGPPQLSVAKDVPMPTPPIPPPWSSSRPLVSGGDTKKERPANGRTTTRKPTSSKPNHGRNEFFRG